MGLKAITGQPILLGGQIEQNNSCDTRSGYCVVYNQSEDKIFVEMIQEPCGDNLVSNGTFEDNSVWTVSDSDQWVISGGKCCAATGSVETIKQSIGSSFTALDKFVIGITVSGMDAGQLEVYLGGDLVKTITENGIYLIYIGSTWGTDELLFSKDVDFNGCIDNITTYELLNATDISAVFVPENGGASVTANVEFFDEYVYISLPASALDEGCYRLLVTDPCGDTIFTQVITDGGFDNPSDWTVTRDPSVDSDAAIFGSQLVYSHIGSINSTTQFIQASQPFTPLSGNKLFHVKVNTNTSVQSPDTDNLLEVYLTDGGTELTLLSVNTFYLNFLYETYVVLAVDPSFFEIGVRITSNSQSGPVIQNVTNSLDDISVEYTDADTDSLASLSNCMKVLADTTGLKVIEGKSDEHRSLGFYFEEGYFSLKARIEAYFQNPHTSIKSESYLKSDGVKGKKYAQVEKAWDLVIGSVDENLHDTIANIISCDHFFVNGVEYISDEKEYQPNWGNKSIANVAESTIEVSRASGTRFNTNV